MVRENRQYRRDQYTVDTDPDRLDLDVIHAYLTRSYWSPGVPREVVAKAIANSLSLGLYNSDGQIGFARVITDYARFAYLCDLFVLEPHRGQGLGQWLVECVLKCDLLDGIRGMTLATRDAHHLYAKCGFSQLEYPESMMEIKYEMPWFAPELLAE